MEKSILIKRISKTEYSFADNDRVGIKIVAHVLTFKNPSPFAYTSEIVKFDRRKLTFKIGMLENVVNYCNENNIRIKVEDYIFPKLEFPIDKRLSGKYSHQEIAVEKFFEKRFGIIQVPTRGGKTFIASEIIRHFLTISDGKCLFVVDNKTLFNQVINDIKDFFKPYFDIEIGEIKAGSFDFSKRVTVAMVQTLQSLHTRGDAYVVKNVRNYMKCLKFLIVDEIHDNCSNSKLKLYKECKNLDFQLCLSATPYRSGAFVQNLKLQEWSGGIIYKIEETILRERGVLSDYLVLLLVHEYKDSESLYGLDYREVQKMVIYDDSSRLSMVCGLVGIFERLKLKTLILTRSIAYGKTLSKNINVPFISGETENDERESIKNEFLKGKGGLLIASDIFKKGITLPDVEVLISADDCLESASVIQKKGRVLGRTENKQRSLVVDILDVCERYFSTHSEARLTEYEKAVGKKGILAYNTDNSEFLKDVEKGVKKWFMIE